MGAFGAFAQGFFTKATEIQDENREESRLRRRRAFDLFVSDTLPKIKRAQAQDTEDIQAANNLAKVDGDFKDKWAMSVAAVKWGRQNNKDPRLFRTFMDTIPNLPDEVLREQEASLERTLNFERDANGNIRQISGFKDTGISPMEKIPQSQGFGNSIMGYSNVGKDAIKGRNDIRAAGYDPDASQTGRFGSIDTGSFSFKPKNPDVERAQQAALQSTLQNMDNIREDAKPRAMAELYKGNIQGFLDIANDPRNNYTQADLDQRAFKRAFSTTVAQAALSSEVGGPIITGLMSGKPVDELMPQIEGMTKDAATKENIKKVYAAFQSANTPADLAMISMMPGFVDAFQGDEKKARNFLNAATRYAVESTNAKIKASQGFAGAISGDVMPTFNNPLEQPEDKPKLPQPKTPEEVKALGPDAEWLDPEGIVRRNPSTIDIKARRSTEKLPTKLEGDTQHIADKMKMELDELNTVYQVGKDALAPILQSIMEFEAPYRRQGKKPKTAEEILAEIQALKDKVQAD